MNAELENKLFKDFPILYKEHTLPMTHTCMCWGLECNDGWEPLIRELSEKIENYNTNNPEIPVTASQVKEKFGTLRFYINGGTDEIYNLVEEYEGKSAFICELCGSPSNGPKGKGWVFNHCEKCNNLKEKET